MQRKIVDQLEQEIERSLTDTFGQPRRPALPHVPSKDTLHRMAKAAVAVYEAVACEAERGTPESDNMPPG